MREMMEAGVHYGHQTKRWNPKMKRLHLRGAQRRAHHRPAVLGEGVPPGVQLPGQHRGRRQAGAVRRHQEAGPGRHPRGGGPRRPVLRHQPLAGRHADQLPYGQGLDRAPAQHREDVHRRHLRAHDQEGGHRPHPRAGEAGEGARRHQGHGRAAGRGVHRRRRQGAHRRQRGPQAGDPDRGGGGHQLRSRRDRLRHPRQRRRHPLHQAVRQQGGRGLHPGPEAAARARHPVAQPGREGEGARRPTIRVSSGGEGPRVEVVSRRRSELPTPEAAATPEDEGKE